MVFGKLLFGFILGNIASTLANAEIRRVKYEKKLGAIQVCDVILMFVPSRLLAIQLFIHAYIVYVCFLEEVDRSQC